MQALKILICTDDSPAAELAPLLVAGLKLPAQTEMTLIGVREPRSQGMNLEASFERIAEILAGYSIKTVIRQGNAAQQIIQEVQQEGYDLVAIGEKGRRRGALRFHKGSVAVRLAHRLYTPLLIARQVPHTLEKILFSTSGEEISLDNLARGASFVSYVSAEIILLHVMSQVGLRPPHPDDLWYSAEVAIQRGTREGRHLGAAMQRMRAVGLTGKITPSMRNGLVLDEVKAEIHERQAQLLVIGSHHQRNRSRILEFLLEDVTGELIMEVPCSVLVV